LGITINCQRRAAGIKSDTRTLLITNKQRVASRGVEKTGLTTEEVKNAECKYRDQAKDKRIPKNGTYFNYPDKIYREIRKGPLFVVHLLGIGEKDDDLSHQKPVVAWSISFPRTELDEQRVEYVVNTTWLRENFLEDVEEDEMGGDND
jgi:hypothetical protein